MFSVFWSTILTNSADPYERPLPDGLSLETLAIRSGLARTQYLEHGDPIFPTSSFVFQNAAQAAARFAGDEEGFIYSRTDNPTVSSFCRRLAALEGGEACVATASGMAAISATMMSLTRAGDHVVAARELFGATVQLFGILDRFGVSSSFVPLTDTEAWARAIRPQTRLLYLESPSNPLNGIADIRAIGALARSHGIPLVIDNCFCSPALQKPLDLGAQIVVHSATKYLDGQGRVLGGAVIGDRSYIHDTLGPFLRTTGPTLSPFNAWVLLKGCETLSVRMHQQSANALEIARWLEDQPGVERVLYPGLESHPQHALAMSQQKTGGAIVSFEVAGADDAARRRNAWALIDHTRIVSITANVGDVKTTITHPASTTHGRVGAEARREGGIGEGLIRLAVGLESPADIIADLERGLSRTGK
jgi:O-succinylhomoserine sulfhydrylase